MQIIRFKVKANYKGTGWKSYDVRIAKPEGSRDLTIANACQLFRRTLTNQRGWIIEQENRLGGYPELAIDKKRLSVIKILSVNEELEKKEELFNI